MLDGKTCDGGSTGIGREGDEPVGQAFGEFEEGLLIAAGMAADLALIEDEGKSVGQQTNHG